MRVSVRREVTSGILLLCWRPRFPESAEQLLSLVVFFFFQFCWFVWHQNPPREVVPAVKEEVKSFKLLLPPVWAVVMCSRTRAVRRNVSVTFCHCDFVIFTWGGMNAEAVATANSWWTVKASFPVLMPLGNLNFNEGDQTLISWGLYCARLRNTWHFICHWFVRRNFFLEILQNREQFANESSFWSVFSDTLKMFEILSAKVQKKSESKVEPTCFPELDF